MPRRLMYLSILSLAFAASIALAESRSSPPYAPAYSPVLSGPADALGYHARLEQARAASRAGKWQEAESLFAQLVRDYPLDRETWVGLGGAQRELGKSEASIASYRRSIELIGPVPGSSHYWIAVQQAKGGDTRAAIATLSRMIEHDHELDRPGLLADPAFESLRADPAFKALAGPAPGTDDRVAGWKGDLDWLLAEIRRLAPAHRRGDLPAATRAAADALRRDIPKLSDAQVYARLAQLVGTLRMGHTMLWGEGPTGPAPGARIKFVWLPVLLYAFPEGLHVVAADDAHRELVGRRLVAIDGVDAATVFERVASATSFASPAEALWTVPVRISDLVLLHGLGVAKASKGATLTLTDARGRTTDVTLAATERNPRGKLPPPAGVAAPLFLQRTQEAHWAEHWPKLATTYVQFNQVAADPDEDLPAFGLRLRKLLAENGARHVIVDLRHNNGGNTFTYVELLRTLTAFSAQEGHHVYALIGRNVYSAAANFSTDLERLVKPVFIGEPTAMSGNQDGDEGRIVLPWSRVTAAISGLRWQMSHPWDERTSVAPQIPVTLTAADYLAGRDPVLETTKSLIAEREKAR